ncbi:MAG TPA: dihydrolipoamide acetyltransferase family protein, partial [Devosia sp.]|nr:dihydrolipoamide acetyltransferase family protein [Devosia sp.]
MAEHVIKMPDVGEGVAEAELVEWNVKVGDLVREDTVLAAVMTDKATVEIPSPVEGKVSWLGGEIGEIIAVGSVILKIEVAGDASATKDIPDAETAAPAPVEKNETPPEPAKEPAPAPASSKPAAPVPAFGGGEPRPAGEKPLASPAVRLHAKEAGVDLRQVSGTGPAHRITHDDLDQFIARGTQPVTAGLRPDMTVEEIKIVGMRRKIAEKMALAKSRIPHITYIEEVDVTALEELRAKLNGEKRADRPKLTLLPFLMRAMVKAIAEQPQINALFDDDAGVIHRHGGVHIGIAAQTSAGLVVPVVRHAEARDLWACGVEVSRLAEAAKAGTATREELSGSTITIT